MVKEIKKIFGNALQKRDYQISRSLVEKYKISTIIKKEPSIGDFHQLVVVKDHKELSSTQLKEFAKKCENTSKSFEKLTEEEVSIITEKVLGMPVWYFRNLSFHLEDDYIILGKEVIGSVKDGFDITEPFIVREYLLNNLDVPSKDEDYFFHFDYKKMMSQSEEDKRVKINNALKYGKHLLEAREMLGYEFPYIKKQIEKRLKNGRNSRKEINR